MRAKRPVDAVYVRLEPALAKRIEAARARMEREEGQPVSLARFMRALVVRQLPFIETPSVK
jgi:hypothetical protein